MTMFYDIVALLNTAKSQNAKYLELYNDTCNIALAYRLYDDGIDCYWMQKLLIYDCNKEAWSQQTKWTAYPFDTLPTKIICLDGYPIT